MVIVARRPLAVRVLRSAGTMMAACLMAGCAHGTLSPVDMTRPARLTGNVAAVKVVLDEEVPADRRHVYEEMAASDVISRALVDALSERHVYDPAGDTAIEVHVSGFRLRSTTNAFFNGTLAGVDMLNGAVSMHQGAVEPVQFHFRVSGEEDWYFKYSAGARFRSMARVLAREVAARFVGEA